MTLPQKVWFLGSASTHSGAPALGDVENHYPSCVHAKTWHRGICKPMGPVNEQRVLDAALAWFVINSHLDVAEAQGVGETNKPHP